MKVIFVKTRSELSEHLKKELANGRTCYRVRSACTCRPDLKNPDMYLRSNQRNGVLVIENDTVLFLVVRCRFCSE